MGIDNVMNVDGSWDIDDDVQRERQQETLEAILPEEPNIATISDAIYFMNERGMWPDYIELSTEQAIAAWRVVEFFRRNGYWPKSLTL